VYWCDEQCKGKETEVKVAWKKYKKRNDEMSSSSSRSSRHCGCEKECVKLLEEKEQRWNETKLGQIN